MVLVKAYFASSSNTFQETVKKSKMMRKRKSPSTKRRNKKRKDEYIAKKKQESALHSTFKDLPVNNIPQLDGNTSQLAGSSKTSYKDILMKSQQEGIPAGKSEDVEMTKSEDVGVFFDDDPDFEAASSQILDSLILDTQGQG